MNLTHRSTIDLAAAMCIVGSSVVIGKLITNQFPIFLALSIRFGIGLPILAWLSYRSGTLYMPSRKLLLHLFLQALTGVFLSNALMLLGLRYTTASQSGLLTSTTPAVITVLGAFALRERITNAEWASVIFSALGVIVINVIGTGSDFMLNQTRLIGNVVILGAVVCEALFAIFRKTTHVIPAMLGATWVTGFGLALCLPFGMREITSFQWSAVTPAQAISLLYYGTFVSVLGYYLWFRGVESAPVGTVGIMSGLIPVSAMVLSTLILGEPFTAVHLLGFSLVLVAIGVMTVGFPVQPFRHKIERS